MADRLRQSPVDYDALAAFLRALGYPTRLELLDVLRFPHTLGEIQLSPRRGSSGHAPARTAARQTIQAHLDKLEEADLVRAEHVTIDRRDVVRYQVNPLKLYALMEELRRLSTMYAGHGPAGEATGTLEHDAPEEDVRGPRVVLVHGVYEGKAYALDRTRSDGQGWVVGRGEGVAVCLDYDPFVSLENTRISHEHGRFVVHDLPGSKNGTAVNWRLLPKGGARPLRAGDVIGVGRSLLSFVPA